MKPLPTLSGWLAVYYRYWSLYRFDVLLQISVQIVTTDVGVLVIFVLYPDIQVCHILSCDVMVHCPRLHYRHCSWCHTQALHKYLICSASLRASCSRHSTSPIRAL